MSAGRTLASAAIRSRAGPSGSVFQKKSRPRVSRGPAGAPIGSPTDSARLPEPAALDPLRAPLQPDPELRPASQHRDWRVMEPRHEPVSHGAPSASDDLAADQAQQPQRVRQQAAELSSFQRRQVRLPDPHGLGGICLRHPGRGPEVLQRRT